MRPKYFGPQYFFLDSQSEQKGLSESVKKNIVGPMYIKRVIAIWKVTPQYVTLGDKGNRTIADLSRGTLNFAPIKQLVYLPG